MRMNLKLLRVSHNLTQQEMADAIGCQRTHYAAIENGHKAGKESFWKSVQRAFDVPDSDMWSLMKKN